MHPRNIYNKPVDFNELKNEFKEFAEKVHIDINGKVKLDFKDPEAVKVLTKCCLQKDFNLDVELPLNKLLPTLPLRLNYILWMQDILNHFDIKENINGIDIGCGSSCIYCLLSVRLNIEWKMFALEIDKENIRYAKQNIERNNLQHCITLIDQEESKSIFEKLFAHDSSQKSFTICNPPFFKSEQEVTAGKNRSGKRKRQQSSVDASIETFYEEGGELGFVSKILKESLELRNKIEIYSSMFGCLENFKNFVEVLKGHKIEKFTTTKLVQGKVIRWAVAWSFTKNLHSFKDHLSESETCVKKASTILSHTLHMNLKDANEKLLKLFIDLKINVKVLSEQTNKLYQFELEARENTWSNQRRKRRRAEERNQSTALTKETSEDQNLIMGLQISKDKDVTSTKIEIFYKSGNMSKDCVNQILQYIKNHFK